jgi:hypothetical protein
MPMASFERAAVEGRVGSLLQSGAVSGALWAVAIAWSTAIRAVALAIVPDDTLDRVVAELVAAAIVTVFAIGIALVVGRNWCGGADKEPTPPSVIPVAIRGPGRALAPPPPRRS